MDASLEGDLDMEEASKYIKICFLCTQEMPKLRPSMSTVVRMLTGEMEVDEKMISKPGLISELSSSAGSRKQDDSSSSDRTMTYGTITFSSIYNRTT